MELLSVKNLSFTYSGMSVPTIRNINFSLNEGDFVVLCGETGCGKSTFLRLLKEELRPYGEMTGSIDHIKDDIRIGFVMQNPKEQVVTDKVWHELAFGMENLGMSQEKMAARSAEISEYFGISEWYEKNVNELSGGQLQILNLASVMVTDPDILILDEPSAQLDPVSTSEFFSALRRLNRDFALTIIIAEHRLEELLSADDILTVMERGSLSVSGKVKEVLGSIDVKSPLFDALPTPYRFCRKVSLNNPAALSIREGRELVRSLTGHNSFINEDKKSSDPDRQKNKDNTGKFPGDSGENKPEPALEFKNVFFRYDRYSEDALKDFNLTVNKGEIFCLLGGNGSGKTTALNVAAGLAVPYSGSVKIFSKKLKDYKNQSLYNRCISMLPQDVQTLFLYNTVKEELESMGIYTDKNNIAGNKNSIISDYLNNLTNPDELMDKHPYDLSGGEQQLIGLAKVLAAEPKLLLLDEPTKGMDAAKKQEFIKIIKNLKDSRITILIVSHDVEFAASCADRCALCFRGEIVSSGTPDSFFNSNNFYTTAVCRMTKGICEQTATLEKLLEIVRIK